MENERTKTNSKKIIIILSIVMIGMVIGILIYLICGKSFLFLKDYRYSDYMDTIKTIRAGVYSGERGVARNYFPFIYIVVTVFDLFIKNPMISYIITFIISCIFMIFSYYIFLKDEKNITFFAMLLITFCSYPIMYEFDRANVEYIVLAFLMLFFIFYKKEKYKIAAVLLSLPICMKLYPAVFILLFLQKRRIKEFFICVFSTILVMCFSYILLGGTIESLPIAIENFKGFSSNIGGTLQGVQYNHTLWGFSNFCNLLINGQLLNSASMASYTITIIIIAILLALYLIFMEKEEWKIITILTIMMITFPHVSFDYTLMHMYIPILYFVTAENTKKWEQITYSILLALTMIPMNYFQGIYNFTTLNIGLLIRPIILISIILTIVFTRMSKIKIEIISDNDKKGVLSKSVKFIEKV